MTPQEKALDLFNKYFIAIPFADEIKTSENITAKQCALIAVDEIMELFPEKKVVCNYSDKYELTMISEPTYLFWQQVKEEIEKL